jgi:hypothetical protein
LSFVSLSPERVEKGRDGVHEVRTAPAAARLPRRKKTRREVLIDDPTSGVGISPRFLGLLSLILYSVIILTVTVYSIPDSANLGGFYDNPNQTSFTHFGTPFLL